MFSLAIRGGSQRTIDGGLVVAGRRGRRTAGAPCIVWSALVLYNTWAGERALGLLVLVLPVGARDIGQTPGGREKKYFLKGGLLAVF